MLYLFCNIKYFIHMHMYIDINFVLDGMYFISVSVEMNECVLYLNLRQCFNYIAQLIDVYFCCYNHSIK